MQFQENFQIAMADQLIFVTKLSHERPKKVAGDPKGKTKIIFMADNGLNLVGIRPTFGQKFGH